MTEDIVVIVRHDLGVEEAKRRLSSGLEKLRSEFASKLSAAEVNWQGPHADLRVGALGQTVTAQLDIEERQVRICIQLPRLLAALAKPITRFLDRAGADMLKLPPPKS